jgi:hypothetical protein
LFAGCKGQPFELGETGGGLDPNGGDSLSAREQRCDDLATRRALDAECWPTRHVGRWHGFVTGDAQYWHLLASPFAYPSGDLLLEVDARGAASLTFFAGDAGAADAGVSGPATPGLLLGFRYELLGVRMTGGPAEDRHRDPRMDFSLILAEPWSASCAAIAADAGPCACTRDGCGVASESVLVTLALSADGQALRGSARSEHAGEASLVGWEFVRE